MMLASQSRCKRSIDADMPAVYWMVDYAGEILIRFSRDGEGRTVRETTFRENNVYAGLPAFGEGVVFLP